MEECKSGIYQIRNLANGKVYVGSAKNLANRKSNHFRDLENQKHHSVHLQRAYKQYGKEAFIFEILEYVLNVNNLINREQHYIDKKQCYNIQNGYNLSPTAGNCLGVKHDEEHKRKTGIARLGKRHTEETKKIIAYYSKIRPIKETTIEKRRISMRGKGGRLNIDLVKEIKLLLSKRVLGKEIAKIYGVGDSTIYDIDKERTWGYVKISNEGVKIYDKRKRPRNNKKST